jgi:hypothetical protein
MSKERGNLVMVQGTDRNQKEFTAFVICNDDENYEISNANKNNKTLDLSKLNVIYKTMGHDIDQKKYDDIQNYYQKMLMGSQSKDYTFAYKGIKEQAKNLGFNKLPEEINPKGVELLDFLKTIKQNKPESKSSEELSVYEKMQAMLIDRAILDIESFYTDVVGSAPNYGEETE